MSRFRTKVKRMWDWIFDGRATDLKNVYEATSLVKVQAAASVSASDQLIESGQRIARMATDLRRYQAASRRKQ
jgi:hypothetical protein